MTDEELIAINGRIRAAQAEMERQLTEWMFPIYEGPPERPPSRWQRFAWRLRGGWYGVREWVAVHVLRVEVAQEEDWE